MVRLLAVIAALLFVGGAVTCSVGVAHDIDAIPPETRAQMTDTDWIGERWVAAAMKIHGVALVAALLAFAISRSRAARRP